MYDPYPVLFLLQYKNKETIIEMSSMRRLIEPNIQQHSKGILEQQSLTYAPSNWHELNMTYCSSVKLSKS